MEKNRLVERIRLKKIGWRKSVGEDRLEKKPKDSMKAMKSIGTLYTKALQMAWVIGKTVRCLYNHKCVELDDSGRIGKWRRRRRRWRWQEGKKWQCIWNVLSNYFIWLDTEHNGILEFFLLCFPSSPTPRAHINFSKCASMPVWMRTVCRITCITCEKRIHRQIPARRTYKKRRATESRIKSKKR